MTLQMCSLQYGILIFLIVLKISSCYDFNFGAIHLKHGFHIIRDGTKWCGMGDIADNDDDLGRYKQLDSCCRTHDKCPLSITFGETLDGLTNKNPIVSSHCDCDKALYHCLKHVDASDEEKEAADDVGQDYFNALNMICFNYTYPATCVEDTSKSFKIAIVPLKRSKCKKYKFDKTLEKVWQWFDMPFY